MIILNKYDKLIDILAKGKQKIIPELEYKISKYVIENISDDGLHLLYSFLTTAFVALTDDEYKNITKSDIKYLYESWILVPTLFNEDELGDIVFNREKDGNFDFDKKKINTFLIFTTTECNARCFYCYEKGRPMFPMKETTAHDVANYILKHADLSKKVTLKWFGGEPLYNESVIDIICRELKEKDVTYNSTMISNGYLFEINKLDKYLHLWNLKQVQITIDGTEDVYNRVKHYIYDVTEVSPFKKIINNIQFLIDNQIKINVRLNIADYNGDDIIDLLDYINDNIKHNKYFNIYTAPLFDYQNKRNDAENEKVFNKINKVDDKIRDLFHMGRRKIFKKIPNHHCMADGGNTITINPNGKTGTCEHFSDSDFWGDIYSDEIKDKKVLDDWKVYSKPLDICNDCPKYPICLRPNKCEEGRNCNKFKRERDIKQYINCLPLEYNKWKKNNIKK